MANHNREHEIIALLLRSLLWSILLLFYYTFFYVFLILQFEKSWRQFHDNSWHDIFRSLEKFEFFLKRNFESRPSLVSLREKCLDYTTRSINKVYSYWLEFYLYCHWVSNYPTLNIIINYMICSFLSNFFQIFNLCNHIFFWNKERLIASVFYMLYCIIYCIIIYTYYRLYNVFSIPREKKATS